MKLYLLTILVLPVASIAQGTSGGGGSLPFFRGAEGPSSILPLPLSEVCEKIGVDANAEKIRVSVIERARDEVLDKLKSALLDKTIKHRKFDSIDDVFWYEKEVRQDFPDVNPGDGYIDNGVFVGQKNLDYVRERYPHYFERIIQQWEWYAEYEEKVYRYSLAGAKDESLGLTPQLVEGRVRDLSNRMAAEIQMESHLEHAIQNKMVETLQSVQVLTLRKVSEQVKSAKGNFREWVDALILKRFVFGLACGFDFESVNSFAVYLPKFSDYEMVNQKYLLKQDATLTPTLIICPGLMSILAPLRHKGHGVDFAIAHELGHFVSLDQVSPFSESESAEVERIDRTLLAGQKSLLACIDSKWGKGFRSLTEVETLLTPVVEEIRSKRDEGRALMQGFAQSILGGLALQGEEFILEKTKGLREAYREQLGREVTATESHSAEILADYWATRVIAPEIARMKGVSIETALGSYIPLMCSMPPEIQFLEDGDDGVYPSLLFRIENVMRHPSLRHSLSQSSTLKRPKGPWCSL